MILEQIDVMGFRGLSRLVLPLEQHNVLIGENAWGKSSLLDVLSLLLAPQQALYQFTPHDFYYPPGEQQSRERHLSATFTWREEQEDVLSGRYQRFSSLWRKGEDHLQRIRLHVEGRLLADDRVVTHRRFIDSEGLPLLEGSACDERVKLLIQLHPVLRLRDARFSRRLPREAVAEVGERQFGELVGQISELTRDVVSRPQNLTDSALQQGLGTLQQLLEHYFSWQQSVDDVPQKRAPHHHRASRLGWRHLAEINQLIVAADSRSRRLILLQMFAQLVQVRGVQQLAPQARPLLLLEDPETRLHPIMLAVAQELLAVLPLQQIATTNSGELLSQVPVEHICRLVRDSGRVVAWRLGESGLSSEDARRIAFHIRLNRPSALFARCWLLVEGETEVWVMNELARQYHYHFAAEGIKVIEFAQSGLKPLLKFARRMGIEWHVLTDGDEAGKKYAATARSQIQAGEHEANYLTQLPALDMEHFLYRQGFSAVYHRIARLPEGVPMNLRRIIAKAISHSSKPDLAIAVAEEAAVRGTEAIPPLLRKMFARVQWLARGKAD
ncbi:ATP-dependent endonuclease [Erwinia sp. JUb26]|uniref:ATP-dependent nuclease n=1 Tax=Erwinia sp. JUb26 TaxID=2485126 RepID=UPI000F46E902|nr:ATP-dependent endonuclease [Erwinia sp. JUb26]ROR11237.1 putative ATP-dependent endonuclease of OLD family [Erwinia sp. JUb26]